MDDLTYTDAELEALHHDLVLLDDPENRYSVISRHAESMTVRELRKSGDSSAEAARHKLERITAALEGLNFVSTVKYEERLSFCAECEHSRRKPLLPKAIVCNMCGCFMHMKARLAGGRCPIGKFS